LFVFFFVVVVIIIIVFVVLLSVIIDYDCGQLFLSGSLQLFVFEYVFVVSLIWH